MTSGSFIPYEMKTSMLKFISYDHKNPVGWLENVCWEKPRHFSNLTQMLFLIDELMDTLDYPQRATVPRTLSSKTERFDAEEELTEAEPDHWLASFRISVLFRQNASWQGSIHWLEQDSASQFRSTLELIQLLDSVLAEYDNNGNLR